MMKDGHLNKCSACTVKDVADWRKRQTLPVRNAEYERAIASGKRQRKKTLQQIRDDHDPDFRKKIALRYFHKRRRQTSVTLSEFDEFVIEEAVTLSKVRERATGVSWHIDHIVPLNHRMACGLHTAANLQVVPGAWNVKKGNRCMSLFFTTEEVRDATQVQP